MEQYRCFGLHPGLSRRSLASSLLGLSALQVASRGEKVHIPGSIVNQRVRAIWLRGVPRACGVHAALPGHCISGGRLFPCFGALMANGHHHLPRRCPLFQGGTLLEA